MRIGTSFGTMPGVILNATPPAYAAPLVNETITYYQVDCGTIEAADCAEDAYGIIDKWGKQDVIHDDEIDYGETQGAVF